MEPVTLATITAGIAVLANEAGKGLAGNAGKAAWKAIQKKFGWVEEPAPAELAPRVAEELLQRPALAPEIVTMLQQPSIGTAQQMVGTINAEKVVVGVNVAGDFHM